MANPRNVNTVPLKAVMCVIFFLAFSSFRFFPYNRQYQSSLKKEYFKNSFLSEESEIRIFGHLSPESLKKTMEYSRNAKANKSNALWYDVAEEEKVDRLTRAIAVKTLTEASAIPPPQYTLNAECTASFNESSLYHCNATGASRAKFHEIPRQVAYMVQFSFEVDTLEILLYEIYDMVDVIFLVECIYTNHNATSKPLVWQNIKTQKRFSDFQGKIVHIVLDDISASESFRHHDYLKLMWSVEYMMLERGGISARKWLEKKMPLRDDDIFVSGDVDEILSREALWQLRHCVWEEKVLSGALWMPYGNLNMAFKPDHVPKGMRFAFSMPTIYKYGLLRSGNIAPLRRFNPPQPASYVMGGIHLTSPCFLPMMILKSLTATEYGGGGNLGPFLQKYQNRSQDYLQKLADSCYKNTSSSNPDRFVPVAELPPQESAVAYIPWFIKCNPARFPYLFGSEDTRLPRIKTYLDSIVLSG